MTEPLRYPSTFIIIFYDRFFDYGRAYFDTKESMDSYIEKLENVTMTFCGFSSQYRQDTSDSTIMFN